MAFVNQAATDIKKKLQKLEEKGGKQIQDLLRIAQRVYNNRETPEDRQLKATEEMTKVLAAVVQKPLDKDQCAYCKEKGHWARECPKKKNARSLFTWSPENRRPLNGQGKLSGLSSKLSSPCCRHQP